MIQLPGKPLTCKFRFECTTDKLLVMFVSQILESYELIKTHVFTFQNRIPSRHRNLKSYDVATGDTSKSFSTKKFFKALTTIKILVSKPVRIKKGGNSFLVLA